VADVIVLVGAGSIGQAIARRVSAGKRVLVADLSDGRSAVVPQFTRNGPWIQTADRP
jgi:saccharopine dehydrogenase-like NADP-dependent oxidoreductase